MRGFASGKENVAGLVGSGWPHVTASRRIILAVISHMPGVLPAQPVMRRHAASDEKDYCISYPDARERASTVPPRDSADGNSCGIWRSDGLLWLGRLAHTGALSASKRHAPGDWVAESSVTAGYQHPFLHSEQYLYLVALTDSPPPGAHHSSVPVFRAAGAAGSLRAAAFDHLVLRYGTGTGVNY